MKSSKIIYTISLAMALGLAGLTGGQVFAQDATSTPDTSISVLEQTSGPATEAPTTAVTVVPTEIPTVVATEKPTQASTVAATVAPTEAAPAATASTTPAAPKSYWTLALGIALLGIFWYAYARRWMNKPKPAEERCARCGFDLTGKTGPCPQCGGTRRLPKV